MLWRFCTYGFLKNQCYIEPFLLLALAGRGMSFLQIGTLLAIRDVATAILEVPSGVLADAYGYRRTLVAALIAYALSYPLLGVAPGFGLCVAAMILWAVGDSFRSGVHKAMIFAWLEQRGRSNEATRVYGMTRSWSKLGSAASVVVAAFIVVVTGDYKALFYFTAIPFVFCALNIMTYPRAVEPRREDAERVALLSRLRQLLHSVARRRRLRRVLIESVAYDGIFLSVKDYVQPVIKIAAVAWFAGSLGQVQSGGEADVALLAVPVYVALHLLSSVASRQSHRVAQAAGGEMHAARFLWVVTAAIFCSMLIAGALRSEALSLAAFVLLYVAHNLWRPVQVARFGQEVPVSQSAGLLSMDNQFRRLFAAALAPAIGLAVDWARAADVASSIWPIGLAGLLTTLYFVFTKPDARQAIGESDSDGRD